MNSFRKILFLIFIMIFCISTACLICCNNENTNNNFEEEVGDYGQIVEKIDNAKITYTLNDFETVSSLYKCRIGWGFGKVSANYDKAYIKSGERSAKIDVNQDGTRTASATLNMPFLVDSSNFDITKLKNIIFDIYNGSSLNRNLSLALVVGSYTSEKTSFTLVSGWNHIEYEPNLQEIEKHEDLKKGKQISFYFDRPNFVGNETYYIDNVIVNNRNYENFESMSKVDNKFYNISNGNGEVALSSDIAHSGLKSLEFKNNQLNNNSLFNIKFNEDQISEIKNGGAIRFYFKVIKDSTSSASFCNVNLLINGVVAKNVFSDYDLTESDWVYVNLTDDIENCKSMSISVVLDNLEGGAGYSLFVDDLSIVEKASYTIRYYKETNVVDEYQMVDSIVKTGYVGDFTDSEVNGYNGYICQPINEKIIKTHNTVVDVKYYNATLGVPYYINYYLAYTDNEEDGYLLDTNYTVLRGVAGEMTEAVPKEYAGYFSKNFDQQIINEDGSTSIDIYYSRDMLFEGFETFEFENGLVGQISEDELSITYFIGGEKVDLFSATTGLTKPSASIVNNSHSGNKALMFTNSSSAYLVWFKFYLNEIQKQALKDGKIISFWYKIESTNGGNESFTTTINSVNYNSVFATPNGEWKQVYLYNEYLAESVSFHFVGSSGSSGFNIYFDDIELIDAPEISYKVKHILVDNDVENIINEENKTGLVGKLTEATIDSSIQVRSENLVKVNNVYYAIRYINQQILTNDKDIIVDVYYDKIDEMAYKVVHKLAKTGDDADGYYTDDSLTQWLGGELGEYTNAKALIIEGYTPQSFSQKMIARDAGTVIEIKYERNMLVDGVELYDYCQAIYDYEDTSVFVRKYKINGEYIPYYVQTGTQKPTVAISSVSHSGNKSVSYTCSNATGEMWIMLQLNSEQINVLEQDGMLSFWYKIVTTKQKSRKTVRAVVSDLTVSGGVYDFITATNDSEWHEYVLTKDMIEKINDSDNKVLLWHLRDCDGTIIYIDDIVVEPDIRPSYTVKHYLQDQSGEYTVLYKEQIKHGNEGDSTNAKALSIAGFEPNKFEQVEILSDNSVVVVINYRRDMLKETFEEMPLGDISLEDSSKVDCQIVEISHKKLLEVIGADKSVVKIPLTPEQGEALRNVGKVVITYTFSTNTRERFAFYNVFVNGRQKSGFKSAYSLGSGLDTTVNTLELEYYDLNDIFDSIELRFEFKPDPRTDINDKFILRIDDIEVVENKNSYYIVKHYLEEGTDEFTELYREERLVTDGEQTTTLAEALDIDGYYALDFNQATLVEGQISTVIINYKKSPNFVLRYYTLGSDNQYSKLMKEETLTVKKPGDLTNIDVNNFVLEVDGLTYVCVSKDFVNVAIEQNNQVVNINCDVVELIDSFEGLVSISDKDRFAKIDGGNVYSETLKAFGYAEISTFSKTGKNSVRYYIYNSETVTIKATMSASQLLMLSKYDTVKLSFAWSKYSGGTSTLVSKVTAYIGNSSGSEIGVYTEIEQSAWTTITITGADKIQEFIDANGVIALKCDVTGYKYALIYIDNFAVEFDQTEKVSYTVKHVVDGEIDAFETETLRGRVGDNTDAIAKSDYTRVDGNLTYYYTAKAFEQVVIAENSEVIIIYELSSIKTSYTVKHVIDGEETPFETETKYGEVGEETEAEAKSDYSKTIGDIVYTYSAGTFTQSTIAESGTEVVIKYKLLSVVDTFETILSTDSSFASRFGKISTEGALENNKATTTSGYKHTDKKSVRYYVYGCDTVSVKATMTATQLALVSPFDTVKLYVHWVKQNPAKNTLATISAFIGTTSGSQIAFNSPNEDVWAELKISGEDLINEFIKSNGAIALKIDVSNDTWKYVYVQIDDLTVEIDQADKASYTVKHVIEGEETPFATETLYGKIGDNTTATVKTSYSKGGLEYTLSANEFSQEIIGEDTEVVVTYKVTKIVDSFEELTTALISDKVRFGKIAGGNIYNDQTSTWNTAQKKTDFFKSGSSSIRFFLYNPTDKTSTLKATLDSRQLELISEFDEVSLSFIWKQYNGNGATGTVKAYIGSESGSLINTYDCTPTTPWTTITITGADKIQEFIDAGGVIALRVDITSKSNYAFVYIDDFVVEKSES